MDAEMPLPHPEEHKHRPSGGHSPSSPSTPVIRVEAPALDRPRSPLSNQQPSKPPNPRKLSKALRRASTYDKTHLSPKDLERRETQRSSYSSDETFAHPHMSIRPTDSLHQASETHRSRNDAGQLTGVESDPIYGLDGAAHGPPPPGPVQSVGQIFSRFPSAATWRTYFLQEVAGDKYLEFQLLLMTLTTGCMDVMTYTTYRVFCSKQTGNTMLLALYSFGHPAVESGYEANIAMSLSVFIVGAIFFGHLGHISRQRLRVWLLVSNLFQALLVLAAAALRYWTPRLMTGPSAIGIVALLSFAESGQIATALNVNMPELNTTMITGALIQLCTDRDILKWHNPKRNRRLAFFVSLLLGSYIGSASLTRYSPSMVLVLVAALKGFIVFTFLFNHGIIDIRRTSEGGGEKVDGAITPVSKILWGD